MAVTVKSAHEIQLMREAGEILAKVHEELAEIVKPGITTMEINRRCEKLIRGYGCIPSFLGYEGFPASVCVSVNDEVVHGIPSKKRVIREGDIVSLDTGVIWKGWQSDAARTWAVGEISKEAQALIDVTRESFFEGLKYAKAGNHLNDICGAIGDYASSRGFGVVRDLVGHGSGATLALKLTKAKPDGQTIMAIGMNCISNFYNGTWEVNWGSDGWTVTTKDGSLAAHYENTILITDGEPEILSLR